MVESSFFTMSNTVAWTDFDQIDIRSGTIVEAALLEGAKKPAFRLVIDFGELGCKRSSAQITALYTPNSLVGKQIIAVVNFPPKQIGKFKSECLVLGLYNENGEVVLLQPERPVSNGCRVG